MFNSKVFKIAITCAVACMNQVFAKEQRPVCLSSSYQLFVSDGRGSSQPDSSHKTLKSCIDRAHDIAEPKLNTPFYSLSIECAGDNGDSYYRLFMNSKLMKFPGLLESPKYPQSSYCEARP